MAINAYLVVPATFTGTLGQSTADVPGSIEIMSYSHNVEMTLVENTASNVSRKAGRVKHDPYTIKKHVDVTTPLMHQHCSQGTVFATMYVRVFQQSNLGQGKPVEFLTIAMKNVIINSVTLNGDGDEMPTEEVKLNYTQITWTYKAEPQTAGSPSGSAVGTWDLALNAIS
jgi:type VI secretion system Hcp family effector